MLSRERSPVSIPRRESFPVAWAKRRVQSWFLQENVFTYRSALCCPTNDSKRCSGSRWSNCWRTVVALGIRKEGEHGTVLTHVQCRPFSLWARAGFQVRSKFLWTVVKIHANRGFLISSTGEL